MAQTFELADLILAAVEAAMVKLFTSRVGRIVAYDAARQAVDVQPVTRVVYTSETGDRASEPLPLLRSVPVVHLGGGPFRTTYPVAAGDTCLLVFSDGSNDRWLAQGGTDVDPGSDRRHSLSDAAALVGLRDFRHALKNAPTNRMSLGHDAGATIEIHADQIRLGSDGARSEVVVQDALDDFATALTAASQALAAGGAPVAPGKAAIDALKTALQALNGSLGWRARTSKVKAE